MWWRLRGRTSLHVTHGRVGWSRAPPQDDYKFLCKHFVDKILSKERDRVSFTATTQGKVKKYVKSFFEDLPQRVFDRRAFESGHSKSKGKASA